MGNVWSSSGQDAPRRSPPPTQTGAGGREHDHASLRVTPLGTKKRTRGQEEGSGEEEVEELSPKRKRIQTTSTYIYETLYKKGVNSDVTITALGKEWKLHKLYLCQSGYFSSMFSGNWKESNQSSVQLDIPDPNITEEALELAFSSLYRDGVRLVSSNIVSTVAAASMLQLEGLLAHCKAFMKETLQPETVVHYLTASSLYCLLDMEEECQLWLKRHLLKNYNVALLKELSTELLTELISAHDLYVMQVEMDVYTLCKRWLFIMVNPDWSGDLNKLTSDAENYFRDQGGEGMTFLETEDGRPYVSVFRAIRLQHILNDIASVESIESDKILPESWLLPLYRKQWLTMLTVDQRLDPGPSGLNMEQFNEHSFRCGRVLYEPGEYCWRWTGFSFGFDVLVLYDSSTGIVLLKRNTRTQPCVSAISTQPRRMIAIRLRATSFVSEGEVCSHIDTGVYQLSLSQDQEFQLITLENPSQFPLYISVNLALTSTDHTQAYQQASSV